MKACADGMVVLTGASSGIGLAMTKMLLQQGYFVTGISKTSGREAIKSKNFSMVNLDLSRLDSLSDELEKIVAGIDMPIRALINNSGIGKFGSVEQLSVSDMRLVMETNFLSHAIVSKVFLPILKRQRTLADIVFMGSESSISGGRYGSIYSASKFAVRGFAQSLREECAKSSVRVSILNPGAVRTSFFDDLNFEPGSESVNAINPEDIAEVLLTIIEARPGTVIDEVNLSPQTKVWNKKPS
tara:strand:- start:184 stop:909 length:726 start_codon:yes stop_codon:yes gene_type:complete